MLLERRSELPQPVLDDIEEARLDLIYEAAAIASKLIVSDWTTALLDAAVEAWDYAGRESRLLPRWRRMRAASLAHTRGAIPSVSEFHDGVERYVRLERAHQRRGLFDGFLRAWEVPEELGEWLAASAAARQWVNPYPGEHDSIRFEPRMGPEPRTDRVGVPPSISWARRAPQDLRGRGKWVTSQNKARGWGAAAVAARYLSTATDAQKAIHHALVEEISDSGLPSRPADDPRAFRRLDRTELSRRIHTRLCELCSDPTLTTRSSAGYACADFHGRPDQPTTTFVQEELVRPWNTRVLFHAGLAARPIVRTM